MKRIQAKNVGGIWMLFRGEKVSGQCPRDLIKRLRSVVMTLTNYWWLLIWLAGAGGFFR